MRRGNGLSRFSNGFSSLGPKSNLFCGMFFNLANVDLLGEVGGTFVWVEYAVDILVVKSVERNFFSFLINLL